ncbi:polysaccharide pyruvyl transferase family protein [Flexithrix dorotheae]|uniref:polysaccharide pyruvyl transferase family protein n=1 Tax=Flexithrix dorotheae TaxID=70993 RepID=UPI000378BCDF|nr:polysaccharide pyruvyl transferase family protein [Flexithrix dorotheae]
MNTYKRRDWLKTAATYKLGFFLSGGLLSCGDQKMKESYKVKTILLVSGWQDVNIGDIAHTPGLLNVLQTFLPETEIILWKRSKGDEVKKLLNKNFPKVKIIYGNVSENYEVDNPEVLEAFGKSDIMIHGSGPSVVGKTNLEAWVKYTTDKPFGIFGTTIQHINDDLRQLLKKATFIYTRETKSIEVLKSNGITGSHIAFAPDATFYFDLENKEKANDFLDKNGLEEKKFICAIPRLRYTPYHKIRKTNWTEEKIKEVEEVNARCKEWDHAKLREAMIAWVRETGNKVLICPEMTYQVDIMDELLIDPLPEDVKPFVVKRGYWMPDEAASVYEKAHTVLSFECHSPILATTVGTPIFYLRQPEDTIKGQMYFDLGFDDWVFEIEETEGKQIEDMLREIWTDYPKAQKKLADSMAIVDQRYKEGTNVLKGLLV